MGIREEEPKLPTIPSDRIVLHDNKFRGVGYVYRRANGNLVVVEVNLEADKRRPMSPFYYNRPIEDKTDPFAPPVEFRMDAKPRVGCHPLAIVGEALRPPNHLYEADDAFFVVVDSSIGGRQKWETGYFPRKSLDPAVWREGTKLLEEQRRNKARLLEFPREYFEVQVKFAKKWSELTGMSYTVSLLQNTVICGRIIGTWATAASRRKWSDLVSAIESKADLTQVVDGIFDAYIDQPHSLYKTINNEDGDRRRFGLFSYHYYAQTKTVKIHFTPGPRTKESGLSRAELSDCHIDLTRMFGHIALTQPEAEQVIGESWLLNIEAFSRIFPDTSIRHAVRIVPPQMRLNGNSVWGQFVDRLGRPKSSLCDRFLAAVNNAKDTRDLIDAFPYPVLPLRDNIENFYRFLGINTHS